MLEYSIKPSKTFTGAHSNLHSFLTDQEENIDWDTVHSFGDEWEKFHSFEETEIQKIGDDYFDLVDTTIINHNTLALDVGCGSGRWARYLANRVHSIEAIDPSEAVFTANAYLKDKENVRVTQASVNNIPFDNESFDFVYSLGVLHHLPDTSLAIENCLKKLKSGGWILLYLYYNLDNRGWFYKAIFHLSSIGRYSISKLPSWLKHFSCDLIALFIYFPFVIVSRLVSHFSENLADKIPLTYYRKTSFRIMRNDALDRFGTPLEKRFSKKEIREMLMKTGMHDIRFSDNRPYWHVIAQKP